MRTADASWKDRRTIGGQALCSRLGKVRRPAQTGLGNASASRVVQKDAFLCRRPHGLRLDLPRPEDFDEDTAWHASAGDDRLVQRRDLRIETVVIAQHLIDVLAEVRQGR